MKTTKSQLKTITDAFEALRWVFDSSMRNYADELLDKCKEEEKGHRGFLPDFQRYHTDDTITTTQAARLFTVKRVAEYLLKSAYPCGQDYLHMQKSCFIAAAIADEFGAKVREAWKAFDLKELSELDYTDFVKVRPQKELEAA